MTRPGPAWLAARHGSLIAWALAVGLLAWAGPSAHAQQLAGANPLGNGADVAQRAVPLPPTPPQGAWGEVIFANSKWIVVQNHQGQQFPVSMEAVSQFLIRWPSSLDALTNDSVVEAIGPDLGSNTLRTDHIDVFEGADRTLVSPVYARVLPNNRFETAIDPAFNRFMNGFDIGAQNLLFGWAYPVGPDEMGIPARLHVVGRVIATNPLRLALPGNNFANILPMEPGVLSITQLTRGDSSFAEKGDLVYLMPTALNARTVVLSQLVLYKKLSVRQFRAK
ncbi:MAG: hypothetical protein U0794_07290 [Isosphaeraceae bacterium]